MPTISSPIQQVTRLADWAKREAMFQVPPVRKLADLFGE